jgi:hypothetical protein
MQIKFNITASGHFTCWHRPPRYERMTQVYTYIDTHVHVHTHIGRTLLLACILELWPRLLRPCWRPSRRSRRRGRPRRRGWSGCRPSFRALKRIGVDVVLPIFTTFTNFRRKNWRFSFKPM